MSKFHFLFGILMLSAVSLSSCKKDEDEPTSTKGTISVKCQISGDLGLILLKGAEVNCLADSGAPIGGTKVTDDKGQVSFGNLNPGTYTITAEWVDGNGFYYADYAAAQVDAGQTASLTLELQ